MSAPISRSAFSRYPMLWLALYFAAGIGVGQFVDSRVVPAAIATFLIACCFLRRRFSTYILPLIFVPLGIFCFQIQLTSVHEDRIKRIYSDVRIESGEPVELEGVLLGLPEPSYGGVFLKLRVDRLVFKNVEQAASGNVRLFAAIYDDRMADEYERLDLRYGSRVRVMCRPGREDQFRNPGVTSRLKILDEQGIDATATIKSPLLIEKLSDEPVVIPLAWVYERRQRLIAAFRESFSDRTAGVMIASLLGDKHFLDRETAEVFRDGGTFHVLVISGLHITFIGGLTLWLVSFFTRRKVWQFVLSSSFLWCYTFAVGAEIPVVRASLMFSILCFSHAIYRSGSLLNALGTCTLLLLVWRPSDLFSASFQLTFVSVAAIIGCAFPLIEKLRSIGSWIPTISTPLPPITSKGLRRFCELLYWNEASWQIENSRYIWSANLFKSPYFKWLRGPNLRSLVAYVFEGVLVSLIVQVWMLPLVVVYFHRVSPASVLMNLWVGAFLGLESFVSIIAVLVSNLSDWLAAPLILLTEFLNSAMMSLPGWLSGEGLAGFRLPVYSEPMRVVYVLFAIAVAVAASGLFRWDPFQSYRQGWRRTTIVSAAVTFGLGLVIVFHPYSAPGATGRLMVDFLDVGQGDSALVTFPNGETMLIDGGGRVSYSSDQENGFEPDVPRIGESVVSEFLWEKGYSRVDYVVATHADADHMQGLVDVVRNFQVGNVLVGTVPAGDPEFADLFGVVERKSIPVSIIARDDQLSIGGAEIRLLNPTAAEQLSTSSNNSSIVMRIAYGERKFLLTADIERETEADLVSTRSEDLRAHVVKVAHHGSRTSSTKNFIEEARADVAIISVGLRSRFGHPHPEVVERWRNAGARVMTTGEKGTITVETNGEDLAIRTFVP